MDPLVVVAGNHRQFLDYCRDNGLDRRHCIEAEPLRLMGVRTSADRVVYTGTWAERQDVEEIVERLRLVTWAGLQRPTREQIEAARIDLVAMLEDLERHERITTV